MCPFLELNGHSYSGYVKLTRSNPGSVVEPGGMMNSWTDDINLIREDAEHAELTKVDAERSGPCRVWTSYVLDHPEATHCRVEKSTW